MAKQSNKPITPDINDSNKKYIRTLRILAFTIPFLAVLIGMLAGSFAPFGNKDVMTSGGMSDHLTYYYELYDRVHEGKGLVYSMTTGAGNDFTTVFTYYLSDPLNLIILIFPRTAILAVINLLYALKIGLAGLFFSIFLTSRKKRLEKRRLSMEESRSGAIAEIARRKALRKEKRLEKTGKESQKDFVLGGSEEPKSAVGQFLQNLNLPILGFSVAFALSAFMLGQGMDVSHLSAIALFPLLLMALDNLLEDGKWKLYAALMTATIFCSFYMALIIFIFSLIYCAAFDHSDLHHAVRNLFLKLIADLLSIGAGALIVFNCLGSDFFRNEITRKFPYGGVTTTFLDVFKALLPKASPSVTSYFGYGIDIFCGFLAVFLFVLYIGNPNISLRRKIGQSLILIVLTLGLFLVTPNHLFNGLFYSKENICVFGFLFVIQLLSMAYEELMNLEHTPVWQLLAGFTLIGVLIAITPKFCDGYDSATPMILAIEFLSIYFIALMLYRNNSMTKRLLFLILPVVLITEMCISYVDGMKNVGIKAKLYETTDESQFYETSRVVHKAIPTARILIYDPETNYSNPVANIFTGYNVILAKKDEKNVDSTLEKMTELGDIVVYQNKYCANGVYMPSIVKEWTYSDTFPFTSLNRLTYDALGIDRAFIPVDGAFETGYSPVYSPDGVEDPRKLDYLYIFRPNESGDLYGSLFSVRHYGETKADSSIFFMNTIYSKETIPDSYEMEYAAFDRNAFDQICNQLPVAACQINSESSVTYQFEAEESGYLMVPYKPDSNWSILVNGSSAEPVRFFESTMLIPVGTGISTVELNYHPTVFICGLLISIGVLLILILLAKKDAIRIRVQARPIQGISGWLQENYVYVLTAGIMMLILIIMQMFTSAIPFGDSSVLGGDGYVQGFNFHTSVVNSVKSGTFSPVDWNIGVAVDQYTRFMDHMMRPWNLLKYAILPENLYLFDYTLGYIIQFLLPGLSIILYLTHRRRGVVMNKKDWRLIVIGTVYGLSSFAIAYFAYGNFGFLSYAPLILLGMERLIYDKKPALYILLLFLQMGDAYYAFILCEFIFLYFFTMEFESVKDFFMKGIRIALSSVAAAALACFRLIPYYFNTLQSPYKEADGSSPVSMPNGSYLDVFSGSMMGRQPVIISENTFDAHIYVGILVMLLIPLYLLNKRVKLSVRIRISILALFLFLGFGNSTLNFILHGFHYQTMVPNRFAAFYILLLVIMFYECMLSWNEYGHKKFCLGIGIPAAVFGAIWGIHGMNNKDVTTASLIMTLSVAGLYLLFALLQLRKKYRKQFRTAMIALCLVEVLISSLFTFRYSIGQTIPDNSETESINKLAERNPDMKKPFVATEYISAPTYNMSESSDVTSISYFSSYVTKAHQDMFQKWNILTSNNSDYYFSGNVLPDLMMHVKYQISNDLIDSSWSRYPIIDKAGDLELHENPYYLPVGFYLPESAELADWDKKDYKDYKDKNGGNAFLYQNAFSHALGCGDIYTVIEPETDGSKITNETEANLNYITADNSAFLAGTSDEIPVQIHVGKDTEGDIYFSYYNSLIYAGTTEKGEADVFQMTMYLPKDQKDYYMRIAVCNVDELAKLHEKLSQYVMKDVKQSFTSFSGTITAPDSGMIYLSVPAMDGWTYKVDGEKVDTVKYLGATGIRISAGEHTIEATYTPPGLRIGLLISVAALVIIIAICVINGRRKKLLKK